MPTITGRVAAAACHNHDVTEPDVRGRCVTERIVDVETPDGPGRLTVARPPATPDAVLLLGHGAGGGIGSFDLVALATLLPDAGVAVARYEQPWVVAGRRLAGTPASLDRAWFPALDAVRAMARSLAPSSSALPLFVGGRSAGARVACRTLPPDAAGLVLLSFPLHPPGRPERSRIAELAGAASDAVMVQGDRDPFGRPDELTEALASVPQAGERSVHAVAGAHGFEPKSAAARAAASDLAASIAAPVIAFIGVRVGLTGPPGHK